MHGPIDYIIVGFEGNKFDGSILKALTDAIDNGVVALVSLAIVSKDSNGNVTTLDVNSFGDDYIIEFTEKYAPTDNTQVNQDDIDEVADLIENNCTAGLLAIEHLWAKPLKKALIDTNGVLLAEGRIHPDSALELDN
jgi:hypothetical protein